MKNLYLTPTSPSSSKNVIALGIMSLLKGSFSKVAFFRPIIAHSAPKRDYDIELINSQFKIDIPYEDCFALTYSEARELVSTGQKDILMEKILSKYNELAQEFDFIFCEGTDLLGKDINFEFALNLEIAAHLNAKLALTFNSNNVPIEELESEFNSQTEFAKSKGADVIFYFFARSALSNEESTELTIKLEKKSPDIQIYILPENLTLTQPNIEEVQLVLNAHLLYGQTKVENLVSDYLVAAMQVNNFLGYINEGNLIITPVDRSDIVLTALSSRLSSSIANISGILLTGGKQLPIYVQEFLDGWQGTQIPILATEEDTYKALSNLTGLKGIVRKRDYKKINLAFAHFEKYIETSGLLSKMLEERNNEQKTPMMFEFQLIEQARKQRKRIVLPEGNEERILRACELISQRNVADIILIGNPIHISAHARSLGVDISSITILNPQTSEFLDDFIDTYYESRKHKNVTIEMARDRMLDATYFATMMVHKGLADGMVSGAINTTEHTVRPALEFIKTKPSFSIVSSVFFICLKDRVLVFGDCAINPSPNAEQLAEIAISAAQTAQIFGINPRVAMLSYSTGSSGKGVDVDKVAEATRIATERVPELLIEGPIQYDAAIDPEVAQTKLPDSQVAGKATVFIFPDLNTGNNTYKAVQRAANAIAIGPVLQGLNKPVNDLSRGCSVIDIVNTVVITAIQAQAFNDANSNVQ